MNRIRFILLLMSVGILVSCSDRLDDYYCTVKVTNVSSEALTNVRLVTTIETRSSGVFETIATNFSDLSIGETSPGISIRCVTELTSMLDHGFFYTNTADTHFSGLARGSDRLYNAKYSKGQGGYQKPDYFDRGKTYAITIGDSASTIAEVQ